MEEGQILVEVHGLRTQGEAFRKVEAFHKADHQIGRLVGVVVAAVVVPLQANQ